MGGSKESAEEYLLGKSITDRDLREHNRTETGPKKIVPVIRQSNASAENEAFTRMMEDPLMHIKLKEQEARNKLVDNPLTMEQIRKEIEQLKKGSKSDNKKHKKDKKKHKKSKKSDKKRKRHRSSSSSSDERYSRSEKRSRHSSSRRSRSSRHSSSYSSSSDYSSVDSREHHRRSRKD